MDLGPTGKKTGQRNYQDSHWLGDIVSDGSMIWKMTASTGIRTTKNSTN